MKLIVCSLLLVALATFSLTDAVDSNRELTESYEDYDSLDFVNPFMESEDEDFDLEDSVDEDEEDFDEDEADSLDIEDEDDEDSIDEEMESEDEDFDLGDSVEEEDTEGDAEDYEDEDMDLTESNDEEMTMNAVDEDKVWRVGYHGRCVRSHRVCKRTRNKLHCWCHRNQTRVTGGNLKCKAFTERKCFHRVSHKKYYNKHNKHMQHITVTRHKICRCVPRRGVRHLSCGKMPKALCNTAKHMKCMESKTCRIKYQAKLCRKDRSCNAKFKVDLEKLKHFRGYYKKVKCGKRRGKAQKICYWHSLCHAFHYKDPIHVKVMCKGFITYMHSPWAAGFMMG